MDEDVAVEVFRLCLYARPWRATLEPLTLEACGPPASPDPPGLQHFTSPLSLLARLESAEVLPDGLR
ncbi:hypothetical protein DKM44_03760 [Deinococcus irradiatisoli]|uniref:Uncharacterized protein n=1 Tax=Deinococcus irradiatisoli TaxID=2202254 RepID=A0A2Z3JG56_9DEIO|nr:hypothetical protein [Deinococcus irradiatisoli]AWN22461.1 hypothetical protein DKM44_03760 [Deinococcus irradiatisoli]